MEGHITTCGIYFPINIKTYDTMAGSEGRHDDPHVANIS